MNTLCLPLLRDAERLDLLKLELPRVARAKKNQILNAVRRPLDREVLSMQNDLAGRLLTDWRSLAQSRNDVASLTALLRLLAASASSEASGPVTILRFGTGSMLSWLSDREVLRRWLCEARTLWRKAIAPIIREGLLPEWMADEVPSVDGTFCPDLFCAARFRERVEMRMAAFRPLFAVRILPHLPCGVSLGVAQEWEQIFLALPPAMQDATDVVLFARHGASGLTWLRLLLREPVERMPTVLRGMIAGGCLKRPALPGTHRVLATLRHVGKRTDLFEDMHWAMRGLEAGASPGWLAGAFRLAMHFKPSEALRPALPDPLVAPHFQGVGWIISAIKRWRLRPRILWSQRLLRVSSLFPGAREMLQQISPRHWCTETGEEWFDWVGTFKLRAAQVSKFQRRWSVMRKHWPALLRIIWKTPESQRETMFKLLAKGLDSTSTDKDELLPGDALEWAYEAVKVFQTQPRLRLGPLFPLLPCFTSAQRHQISGHLPALMTAIKKLGWGWNSEFHLKEGAACIPMLGRRVCLFILLREPKLLLRALLMLGAMKCGADLRVAKAFAEHPLASCDPEKATLGELAVMVDASSAGRELGMPVKQRTWDHIHDLKPLAVHLLHTDRTDLENAWARLAVEVLHELINRELRLQFQVQSGENVSNLTLLYVHTLDEQRRKAKRVVRSLAMRQPFSREHHPQNLRWRATLPEGIAAQWALGFQRSCELPKHGLLSFETECDPLEIFRMGDYGGSCLGIGSCNQYSSLTNALDANKQVVYARDAQGKVVGRQLLALSNAGTLVCFHVYPLSSSGAMQKAFIQYDRAYAAALNVPLHRSGEYKVSSPMNMEWYDDGAWTPWEEKSSE